MNEKYIISFDNMPCCTYREHDEIITQFTFPNSLVPASTMIKKDEPIIVNDRNYIIKDRVDIMGYTIIKCIEDK